MLKKHTLNTTASATSYAISPASVVDQLESVDELLCSLFMMASDLENETHAAAFRRVIECAEENLAIAVSALENDAARLRKTAEEMRQAEMLSPRNIRLRDELVFAIKDYRNGAAAFDEIKEADWAAHGGEEAVIKATYAGPLEVLEAWDKPATSLEGALEALRFAHEENQIHSCSDAAKAMLAAALAFFDQETG